MERNILDFIESHLARVLPLEKERNDARWKLAVHGRPADRKRLEEKRRELDAVYADREAYARILTYDEGGLTETDGTRRQLRLLRLAFAVKQLPPAALDRLEEEEDELRSTISTFRIDWGADPVSLSDMADYMRHEEDAAERREVWESMNVLGERLGPLILRLVGIRNRSARELGYRNFHDMSLDLQEISLPRLLLTVEDVVRSTDRAYAVYKKELDRELGDYFSCRLSALRPWHYGDTLFEIEDLPGVDIDDVYGRKDPVRIARAFFEGQGLDPTDVLKKSDLNPREGKDRDFVLHMDRTGKDVRIFASNGGREARMRRLLRLIGIALYYRHLPRDLDPLVRTTAHPIFEEAVGGLFARLSRDPDFLVQVVGGNPATIDPIAKQLRDHAHWDALVGVRWTAVLTLFERALYENPGQDLNRTWWDLIERYLGVTPPERRAGRHDWATRLEFSLEPMQSHFRFLGDLVGSQLKAAIAKEHGETFMGNPGVGSFLTSRLFSLGARENWVETLKRVTGEPLRPVHFLEDRLALE